MKFFHTTRSLNNMGRLMEEQIIGIIGQESAELLFNRFYGSTLHFPYRMDESHMIAKTIGIDAARKLTACFGGESFYISTRQSSRIKARNQLIIRDKRSGMTTSQLVAKYKLTARQLSTILNARKNNDIRTTRFA